MIRVATEKDVPAILEIYRPYILETTITFEYDVPTLEAFIERYRSIAAVYPYFVYEEAGEILGYAYASKAFERSAYQWDVDLSVYLRMDVRGRGIGTELYKKLIDTLRELGYHNVYGLITGENDASKRFHSRMGFSFLGSLPDSGYKFERWLAVDWYGLRLRPAEKVTEPPKVFKA
ncbi:MAG: N-acetyltransferase family protein [Clostridia bacterium]|nr:N-acetyltransferase family protein [Clostridia bacterium]